MLNAVPPPFVRRKPRLLLVEDHPDTRYLLSVLLEEIYDLTIAETGAAAARSAEGARFDLVLMDIHLGPGSSGVDVLGVLRSSPLHREVPIVALTSYAAPGDRERFLAMGFTAYLPKPFDADELLDLLAAQRHRRAA